MPNALQNIKFHKFLAPIDITGATATDLEVDTLGWHYLAIHVLLGNVAADMTALTVNESDTAAQTGDVIVTFTAPTAAAGDGDMVACFIDLRKRKRYISIVATGGAGATLISIVGLLYRGDQVPDSVTERGLVEQFII